MRRRGGGLFKPWARDLTFLRSLRTVSKLDDLLFPRRGLPDGDMESACKASFSERRTNEPRRERDNASAGVHERSDLRAVGTSERIVSKRRNHPRQIISPRAGRKRSSGSGECPFGSADCGPEVLRFARISVRARRLAPSMEWPRTCLDSNCSFMQV